ncbi:MAG: hypothetical protein LBJ01_07575, partial [Tannerella sp.]|nr:hypothetical protein [Tannerella sp.]
MNTARKMTVMLSLLSICGLAGAQKGLHIEDVFSDFGRQKGAVLIELAEDVLGRHTRISRYRSLTLPASPDAVRTALDAIRTDLDSGKILMESKRDGLTETGYYL